MEDEAARSIQESISGQFVHAISGLFQCLGRALICLGPDFTVVHASESLDALTAEGTAEKVLGVPIEQLMGVELFGENGSIRRALLAGERREGWGATIRLDGISPRLMSVTAAPVVVDSPLCDPRVAYLLVVRSAEDVRESSTTMPTMFSGMIARSQAMLGMFRLIRHLEGSDATVLITGESGTGKELVARALHLHSPRRENPFVAVNCGALPADLLESELFGHVRGAFTGAVRDRAGRFEVAEGGTLFLDEVGDLPLSLQVKLLRVLQERSYERVGESITRHADVRVVAATHRDLRRAALEGGFREDLFYRLRVVPIALTPLHERREDVEPLARHLLARVCDRQGRSLLLSPDALRALLRYPWPGNVRELENALEYAVAVCQGQTILEGDLPAEVRSGQPPSRPAVPPSLDPGAAVAAPAPQPAGPPEADGLRAALDEHRWNRAATAEALGISRTTLWRRMRELGLAD